MNCNLYSGISEPGLKFQKRFDFWDFTSTRRRTPETGNSEARRDTSDRGRRRRLQKRCARRCIAADAHDASSNIRAAAVMRDVVPVTSADDALPHGTELASCRCCGGPSAMQHIGCDHACSSQARTTRRLRRSLQRHRKPAAISQFPVSGFPVSRLP